MAATITRRHGNKHRTEHGSCRAVIEINFLENISTTLARVTGLEPATSGVTGRRSNQLSYTRVVGAV
jgi:hypothetical protein